MIKRKIRYKMILFKRYMKALKIQIKKAKRYLSYQFAYK